MGAGRRSDRVVFAPIFVGVAAGLYTMGADGRDVRALVPDARMVPKWSPDGSRILVVGGNPAMLHVVDADGSNLTRLGNLRTGLEGGAEWSPDGRRIGVSVASCQQFVLMDADGSNQVRVVAPHPVCGHTWSPDGKLIAYNSAGQPNNGIFLLGPTPLIPSRSPATAMFKANAPALAATSPQMVTRGETAGVPFPGEQRHDDQGARP